MNYRLVIFDFDGTLADSLPWFSDVFNDVADRYGFRRTDAPEREALRQCDAREILSRLAVPRWKVPLIARHLRRLKSAELDRIRLFDGVEDLLRALRQDGVVLAIVSSDTEPNIRRVLGSANAALIDHFACSAGLFGKSRKIRQVLRRARVAPRDVLCVGDELRDLEAARRTGAAFAAATWGYATAEAMAAARPTAVLRTLGEIPNLVGATSPRPATA